MKFTRATNIGLHVLTYMIQNKAQDENLTISQLADKFDVSTSYLAKILTTLAKGNLIRSVSGVKGGYKLRANYEDITYYDVISLTEGLTDLDDCIADDQNICPINQVLQDAENLMWDYLKEIKLAEVHGL